MKHALIIGGTGMLANVSLWLLDHGYHVSIVARGAKRMDKLIEKTNVQSRVTPLFVDYTESDELQTKITETIKQKGKIDMVVAWIHSTAENALQIVAQEVAKGKSEWDLFHVLGSRTDLAKMKGAAHVPAGCEYYQIQLGFVDEETYARWLTNEEISSGVIEAIKKKEKVSIVGQLG